MNKLERLGCLYLTFLNNPAGLRFGDIKEYLPLAYEGDLESARRKFERDKDDLRKLGMDLKHYSDGQQLPDGRIARGHIYVPEEELQQLPEIRLTEEQARTLSGLLFGAIASLSEESKDSSKKDEEDPVRQRLESAAKKLLYKNPAAVSGPPPGGSGARGVRRIQETEEEAGKLDQAHEALLKHFVIRIYYPDRGGEGRPREVEGRGLVAHRGRWCLVAYCRKAKDIRTFYIDRIQKLEVLEEVFVPDSKFNIKNHSLHPLALRMHEPRPVRLQVREAKDEVLRDFLVGLPERVLETVVWDEMQLSFQTGNLHALFSWMVRHPDAVSAMGPSDVRAEFIAYLDSMKELHRE